MAERLLPDTVIGCKRMCVDTGYYETFNRPNVHLVDLRETPIEEITPSGHPHVATATSSSTRSCSPPASTR